MSHKIQYLRALTNWISSIPFLREKSFTAAGTDYRYFNHLYNFTWINERTVEIPLMARVLSNHPDAKKLEVGHVLGHYDSSTQHDVVDKYEKSGYPFLFNEDATDFKGNAPYDLILSISTFEHVGWDEMPRDLEKASRSIQNLRSLLSSQGRMYFTVPVGYSPGLDQFLDQKEEFISRTCLRRVSIRNEWREVDWEDIRRAKFHTPYPFANGLVFAEMGPIRVD
jgi:hypothetical protein